MTTQNFVNYSCWDPTWVSTVLDIDADSVEDSVFMATHTDPYLQVDRSPNARSPSTSNLETHTATQLLEEVFLDPKSNHVQFAVIGEPGTGKSHLIKWMDLAMPDSDKYEKIRVPRAGSTLLGVLKQIVSLLPDDQREQYDSRISQGGAEQLTYGQKTYRILTAIAVSINEDSPLNEAESLIFKELPSLFSDPDLVEVLPENSPIIGELASHIFDSPEKYERRQTPRRFNREDLQLDRVSRRGLASTTKGLLANFRDDPQLMDAAIEIVNRNLDTAIAKALAFSGEDLITLIREVRTHLKNSGKELIVLVEDLVRNQGYDQSLMDALLERADDQNGYCVLRWGVAVTTGGYANLIETVRDRMTFVVNMNVHGDNESDTFAGMAPQVFVSRYLNAVRIGGDSVRNWYEGLKAGTAGETLDSHCVSSGCQFVDKCHDRFGKSDDIGLYPFTNNAILNIAERVGAVGDHYNPRVLLSAIAEVLDRGSDDLKQNLFPTIRMFKELQDRGTASPVLNPTLGQNLGVGGSTDASRQQVLIELWSRVPGNPAPLDAGVFESFGLAIPPNEVYGVAVSPDPGPNPGLDPVPGPDPVPARSPLIKAITEWGSGAALDDRFRRTLNPMLYRAIETHIDWDSEGLIRTEVAQATNALFTQTSFEFRRQAAKFTGNSPVHLVLPEDDDNPKEKNDTALALIGLVQYQQIGSWDYPDSAGQMIALANRLEHWASQVLSQIRGIVAGKKEWQAPIAARELLAVGAFLSGHSGATSDQSTERLNALFDEWDKPPASASDEWRNVRDAINDKRARLENVGMIDASGTKGGLKSSFLIPRTMARAVDRMVRDWSFTQKPPEGSQRRGTASFQDIEVLYKDVSTRFERLANIEFSSRKEWLDRVREHVEPGTRKRRIVDSLKSLEVVRDAQGAPVSRSTITSLNRAIDRFDKTQFDSAVTAIESLLSSTDQKTILANLSGDRTGEARAASLELFDAAIDYLNELELSVSAKQRDFGIDGMDGVIDSKSRIKTDLADLEDVFNRMDNSNAD
jgi:hypothetical protein